MELYFNIIPNEINFIILHYIKDKDAISFIDCLNYKQQVLKHCITYFFPVEYLFLCEYYEPIYIYFTILSQYQYLLNILRKEMKLNDRSY